MLPSVLASCARCLPWVLLVLVACGGERDDRSAVPTRSPLSRVQEREAMAAAEYEALLQARAQAALAIENEPPEQIDEEQFYQLLAYHCGECHLPLDHPTEANRFADFDNLDRMIAVGKVSPGRGEQSRLVLRMRRGEMPPPELPEMVPMPQWAIDLIADFIDGLPQGAE